MGYRQPAHRHDYRQNHGKDFSETDRYISNKQVKQLNEDQKFNQNPYFSRIVNSLLSSNVPAYVALGAGLLMIGAGVGGMAYHDINDSHSDATMYLEKIVDEKPMKTRATEQEYKPMKISGDGENAQKPIAIDETKVVYASKTDVGYDILTKSTDGSNKDTIFTDTDGGKEISGMDSDGKYIAFDNGNQLKTIDLKSKSETLIDDEYGKDIQGVAISNNIIAYEVCDIGVDRSINKFDIGANEKTVIAKNVSLWDIYTDGNINKILYQDYSGEKLKLILYDMITKTDERLNPDSDMNEDQGKIYGEYIVFTGDSNVYLKNWNTGELKDLGEGSHPDINKNLVVWHKYIGSDFDLYVYDISDGKTTQIKLDGNQEYPSVFDGDKTDYIVFTQQETGFDDPSVWLVDLSPETMNQAPNLEQILSQSVAKGAGWSGKLIASDPDNDTVTEKVEGDAFQLVGDTITLKESYKSLPGRYMCRATATDEHGASKSIFFNITINEKSALPNNSPEFKSIKNIYSPYGNSASGLIEVSDKDGDKVFLSMFNGSGTYFDLVGNEWALKPEYITKPGTYMCEVRASD
ncbi:MAG: hypothetical protein PHS34_08005, partial [Candidatus Omnitrophica bacterium]|nr:hypothetical protein [Candidatus Omnitrophota bacterium]